MQLHAVQKQISCYNVSPLTAPAEAAQADHLHLLETWLKKHFVPPTQRGTLIVVIFNCKRSKPEDVQGSQKDQMLQFC